jgi:hypothetical protein
LRRAYDYWQNQPGCYHRSEIITAVVMTSTPRRNENCPTSKRRATTQVSLIFAICFRLRQFSFESSLSYCRYFQTRICCYVNTHLRFGCLLEQTLAAIHVELRDRCTAQPFYKPLYNGQIALLKQRLTSHAEYNHFGQNTNRQPTRR